MGRGPFRDPSKIKKNIGVKHSHSHYHSSYQSNMDVRADLCCAVSKITPHLDKLCDAQQAHPSHFTPVHHLLAVT